MAGAVEEVGEVLAGVSAGVSRASPRSGRAGGPVRRPRRGSRLDRRVVVRWLIGRTPPSRWCRAATEWVSSARTTSPGAPAPARWSRIEARSSSANRPAIAASPRASSTGSAPRTAANSTARAIFARIRCAPDGAGLDQPAVRALAEVEERDLGLRCGAVALRRAGQVPARVVRVVLVERCAGYPGWTAGAGRSRPGRCRCGRR